MPLTGAAAARLYDDHVDAVYAMIARRVGAGAAAAITSEAFQLAVRTWDRFDTERGTERLFLYGVAARTLRGHVDAERAHLRALRITSDALSADVLDPLVSHQRAAPARVVEHESNADIRSVPTVPTDDDVVAEPAAESRLMEAVADLDPEDRDIVLLSLWESCQQSSIAEALELSVGPVRSALGRIRRELKIAVSEGRAMNVFDTIHAVRPDIDPMRLADRRMIRESLFGVGHEDTTRSFGARSESGAVVSTAPRFTRVPLRRRPRPTGSIVRMLAGLAAVAAVGVVAWSVLSEDDSADTATESSAPPTEAVTAASTAPPTTMPPFVRTGVSRAAPLVLPASLLTVDEVTVTPAGSGSSTLLLTAPDGTTMWAADFDGEPADFDALDVRQVGAVGVGVPRNAGGAAVTYQLVTPCGVVVLNDAPGAPPYRPEIVTLFESMSLDANATIDVSLPAGFSVLDIGAARTSYAAQFQVPVFAETRPARLVQIPEGSISQLMFGGRQLAPATFLGGPAFVDAAPLDPAFVSIYWQDGPTVFNVSSAELTFEDLESFIGSLEPVTVDDWARRFDVTVVEAAAPAPACAPQPSFGPTLDP